MSNYYVSACVADGDDVSMCDDSVAQFWTLYRRNEEGFSEGIIDCMFREDAEAAMRVYKERDALAAENAIMQKLLTDISENHVEYFSEGESGMFAGVPLDYVSEINTHVSRDVNAENPFPATDSYLNSVRAEGIHFAANRMLAAWESGFIDDTPAQVHDISGAVLSALEFLPNASPEEFKRDYADEVRSAIAAQLRAGEPS